MPTGYHFQDFCFEVRRSAGAVVFSSGFGFGLILHGTAKLSKSTVPLNPTISPDVKSVTTSWLRFGLWLAYTGTGVIERRTQQILDVLTFCNHCANLMLFSLQAKVLTYNMRGVQAKMRWEGWF